MSSDKVFHYIFSFLIGMLAMGILLLIMVNINEENTIMYQNGYSQCEKNLNNNELIHIDFYGALDVDFKETDMGFDNTLTCNMTSGNCGNDMYYNDGKGFIWGGLHRKNYTGITVIAKLSDFSGSTSK